MLPNDGCGDINSCVGLNITHAESGVAWQIIASSNLLPVVPAGACNAVAVLITVDKSSINIEPFTILDNMTSDDEFFFDYVSLQGHFSLRSKIETRKLTISEAVLGPERCTTILHASRQLHRSSYRSGSLTCPRCLLPTILDSVVT